MSEREIKDCPFCGCTAFLSVERWGHSKHWGSSVVCRSCMCRTATCLDEDKDKACHHAVSNWNNRGEAFKAGIVTFLPTPIHKSARVVLRRVAEDRADRSGPRAAPKRGRPTGRH